MHKGIFTRRSRSRLKDITPSPRHNSCKIHLITYGTHAYRFGAALVVERAGQCGEIFNRIHRYDYEQLDPDFRERYYEKAFKPPISRIDGYGIWKPQIIKQELEQLDIGDIVLYVDASMVINPARTDLLMDCVNKFKDSEHAILVFGRSHVNNEKWVTKEIAEYFKREHGLSETQIYHSGDIDSAMLMFRKCAKATAILDDYFRLLEDDFCAAVGKHNRCKQREAFVTSRHDQMVFNLLVRVHGAAFITGPGWFEPSARMVETRYNDIFIGEVHTATPEVQAKLVSKDKVAWRVWRKAQWEQIRNMDRLPYRTFWNIYRKFIFNFFVRGLIGIDGGIRKRMKGKVKRLIRMR